MQQSQKVKVWLSCPKSHAEQVRMAIGDAGLGVIGNYSHCSVVSEIKGYFKPMVGTNPHIGAVGDISVGGSGGYFRC